MKVFPLKQMETPRFACCRPTPNIAVKTMVQQHATSHGMLQVQRWPFILGNDHTCVTLHKCNYLAIKSNL